MSAGACSAKRTAPRRARGDRPSRAPRRRAVPAHLDAREAPRGARSLDVGQRARRRAIARASSPHARYTSSGAARGGRRACPPPPRARGRGRPGGRRRRPRRGSSCSSRPARSPARAEEAPDLPRHHVDARRRLVEDEERRTREERVGDASFCRMPPTAHPPAAPERREPDPLEQLGVRRRTRPRGGDGGGRVKRRFSCTLRSGCRLKVCARSRCGPSAPSRPGEIDAEDGRLLGLTSEEPRARGAASSSRAIGSHHADDLAPLEHEVDPCERRAAAVALVRRRAGSSFEVHVASVPGWSARPPPGCAPWRR